MPEENVSPPKRPSYLTSEIEELILHRYEEEGISEALLNDTGLSSDRLRNAAFYLKVKCQNKYKKIAENRFNNKNSVDRAYFTNWSPNMAWILGYIYADACNKGGLEVNRGGISFCCEGQDAYILHKIKNELKSKHTVGGPYSKGEYQLQVS